MSNQLLVVWVHIELSISCHYLLSHDVLMLSMELTFVISCILTFIVMLVIGVIKPYVMDQMLLRNLSTWISWEENVHVVVFREVILWHFEFKTWLEVLFTSGFVFERKSQQIILYVDKQSLIVESHGTLIVFRLINDNIFFISKSSSNRMKSGSWTIFSIPAFFVVPYRILMNVDLKTIIDSIEAFGIFKGTLHGIISQYVHSEIG